MIGKCCKACGDGSQAPLGERINLPLSSGTSPEGLQEAVLRPLLKDPSVGPTVLANHHCPVSNPLFLSKAVERAAAGQVFLGEADLLGPVQPSFRPDPDGTEMALVLSGDLGDT